MAAGPWHRHREALETVPRVPYLFRADHGRALFQVLLTSHKPQRINLNRQMSNVQRIYREVTL